MSLSLFMSEITIDPLSQPETTIKGNKLKMMKLKRTFGINACDIQSRIRTGIKERFGVATLTLNLGFSSNIKNSQKEEKKRECLMKFLGRDIDL